MNEAQIRRAENRLFFRRWLKNPRQLGTLAPISVKLSQLAAQAALRHYKPDKPIVEIGAGTGRLTRSLLNQGVRPQDLTAVELDGEMCGFLRDTIPHINVVEGDANHLTSLVAPQNVGRVCAVVSAIPLMYLPETLRMSLVKAAFSILENNAGIIHVTYNPRSPLQFWKTLEGQRVASAWFNFPPGFVWQFQRP